MSRPNYETPEDRENERFVAEVLTGLWKLSGYEKNPKKYGPDFSLFRVPTTIWAYAEVKTRPGVTWLMPGGYYIALSKVIAARQMSEEGLRCALVVRCAGGEIACWNFNQALPGAIWAGRKDRNDPDDMEPHKVFSWETAKLLK